MRLEYELKQKTEISNKQISDIRMDIDNLQLSLNDKMHQNKKLCNDFNALQNLLDERNNEIEMLRNDISTLINENNYLKQDKNKIESHVNKNQRKKGKKFYQFPQFYQFLNFIKSIIIH